VYVGKKEGIKRWALHQRVINFKETNAIVTVSLKMAPNLLKRAAETNCQSFQRTLLKGQSSEPIF